MEYQKEEILKIIKSFKNKFYQIYGVTDIGIFGSYSDGTPSAVSDVDVVVKLKNADLFYLVHIKETLESELNTKVDIVQYRDKMNPYLKKQIDSNAIFV